VGPDRSSARRSNVEAIFPCSSALASDETGPFGPRARTIASDSGAQVVCDRFGDIWITPIVAARHWPGLHSRRPGLSEAPPSAFAQRHSLRCPAARRGRPHRPDDAQAEPRETDVGDRTAAFVGHRAAGSPWSSVGCEPGPGAAFQGSLAAAESVLSR